MPENNCHIQYASCLVMGVPLDATCAIVAAAPSFAMVGFTEMAVEPERQEGTDYSANNMAGARCGPELKGKDRVKWGNGTGAMCLVDWGLMSATTGNPLVLNGDGDTIGYEELVTAEDAVCDDESDSPKMALAIVRKAASGDGGCVAEAGTGATGLVLHELPQTRDWTWTDSGFRDERNVRNLTFRAYNNPLIGAGPWNLWPATADPDFINPNSFHSEVFITNAGLPTPGCATIAHPAVSDRSGS
jgi:hypothetical protein